MFKESALEAAIRARLSTLASDEIVAVDGYARENATVLRSSDAIISTGIGNLANAILTSGIKPEEALGVLAEMPEGSFVNAMMAGMARQPIAIQPRKKLAEPLAQPASGKVKTTGAAL